MTSVSEPTTTEVPGRPSLLLGAFEASDVGYSAREYFVSGTATSYAPSGPLDPDGAWTVTEAGTADYTTRIVVLLPDDPATFNGTVLVEWLNVSGGIDAPAVWFMAHREITRAGYAYVAVSAQQVGVEGGASLTGLDMSLKAQDSQRYADLNHPGDAYAFDIFSMIGKLVLRTPGSVGIPAPQRVIAVGESQSAMFLTTYVNAVDPLAATYDGFLVHSRFGPAAPLDGASILADGGIVSRFRTDLRAPVANVLTETDVLGGRLPGYHLVRQSDSALLRTWEIAGAAHADNYTILGAPIDTGRAPIEDLVAAYAPIAALMGKPLDYFINFAPQHHYVVQAALAGLHDWVRTGRPMPAAPPLELAGDKLVLDSDGLARGGLRTPWVDVSIAVTRGQGSDTTDLSFIFGSGEPFDPGELARRYPGGVEDYLARFTTALDAAIAAGHLCAADRAEILALAGGTFRQFAG
jgi:Alpha/beta hydrolase domain